MAVAPGIWRPTPLSGRKLRKPIHVHHPTGIDAVGCFLPPTNFARAVFVFGHSGDDGDTDEASHPTSKNVIEGSGKYWPYLLRVRYRLMDGRGKYRSVDPVSSEPIVGRWFEQIIPVPRPSGTF